MAYHYLGRRAHLYGLVKSLDAELRWALGWWLDHLESSPSRVVLLANAQVPVVIFTDGACDPNPVQPYGVKSGYGAVMYDPEDQAYEYFGAEIQASLMGLLTLGQAEILPCLASGLTG